MTTKSHINQRFGQWSWWSGWWSMLAIMQLIDFIGVVHVVHAVHGGFFSHMGALEICAIKKSFLAWTTRTTQTSHGWRGLQRSMLGPCGPC